MKDYRESIQNIFRTSVIFVLILLLIPLGGCQSDVKNEDVGKIITSSNDQNPLSQKQEGLKEQEEDNEQEDIEESQEEEKDDNTAHDDSEHESEEEDKSEIVYITKTGTCYHKSDCTHLRNSRIAITEREAIKNGYTKCTRCFE